MEWETLQNVKWEPLINETYDDIIESVGYFTNSATRILKSKTPEDVWKECKLKRDMRLLLCQLLRGVQTDSTT